MDTEMVLRHGKYLGDTIASVMANDPDHILWLAAESSVSAVRDIAMDMVGTDATHTNQLYQHQLVGVRFISNVGARCIISDEMGLGKTITAIAYMNLHPGDKTLIICPAGLKMNWGKELDVWLTKDQIVQSITGRTPVDIYGDIIIINYDIVAAHKSALVAYGFHLVVADESHYIKNRDSKRTKAVMSLCKNIQKVILLSGTPLKSRPAELWSQLACIDHVKYDNFYTFAHKYCDAHQIKVRNRMVWDFRGASDIDTLRDELLPIMLRRTKDGVLDLPDKISQVIPMECVLRDYNRVANECKKAKTPPMVTTTKLVMGAMRAKIPHVLTFVGDLVECGHKTIVFCTHNDMLDAITDKFADACVCVRGGMRAEDKDVAVETFQHDPNCMVFVGNVQAAGVGITLTAASHVVFAETPWTPADVDQAADRAHRMGQKNMVNVYHLCATNTVDEHIIDTVVQKRCIFDGTMASTK